MITSNGNWRTKNAPKHFFNGLKGQNMQNQKLSKLYANDNK